MPMITAYDKRTGKRAQIPERWLGSRLGVGYSRTPPTAAPKTPPAPRRSGEPKPPVTGDTEKED
jgi:hypothetical protein